mgnify:CR=1 FL=1
MNVEGEEENFEDLEAVGEEHRAEIITTTKEEVMDTLKEELRPEFLNRIDEVIVFLPLTKDEIKQILLLLDSIYLLFVKPFYKFFILLFNSFLSSFRLLLNVFFLSCFLKSVPLNVFTGLPLSIFKC